MRKRGQAAMEFLMTYGWAILVVLAAIAALAYFGVLSPDRFLPEDCTLPSGTPCLDSSASDAEIQMVIQNAAGFDMSDLNVSLVGDDGVNSQSCAIGDSDLSNGEKTQVNCTYAADALSTGKYKATINLAYTNADSGLAHTKTGQLITKIP